MNIAFAVSTPLPRGTWNIRPAQQSLGRVCIPLRTSATKRPRAIRASLNSSPADGAPRDDPVLDGPFDGVYGQWYLTQSEADGVTQYRQALSVMSACMTAATALALTTGDSVPAPLYDALFLTSTAAFFVALQRIHIYAAPLHAALKVLWGAGAVGAAALLLAPQTGHHVVVQAFQNPVLMLAIGWQFVALTGLFIKEAFCFGRAEALALIALIPVLSGGHFVHVLPLNVEQIGAVVFASLFTVFCARKFTQPAQDDIGDLSVFEHLAKGGQL